MQDPYPVVREKLAGLSGDLQTVAQALEPETCSVDQLVAATGLPANKVLAALTMLSIKGIALQHPGNRVSLKIQ